MIVDDLSLCVEEIGLYDFGFVTCLQGLCNVERFGILEKLVLNGKEIILALTLSLFCNYFYNVTCEGWRVWEVHVLVGVCLKH